MVQTSLLPSISLALLVAEIDAGNEPATKTGDTIHRQSNLFTHFGAHPVVSLYKDVKLKLTEDTLHNPETGRNPQTVSKPIYQFNSNDSAVSI